MHVIRRQMQYVFWQFFLIWESNSDSITMSYKISMPKFVPVSVQREYCYLGYTVQYLWCVFFIARMLFDHFIGFYALIYICSLFKQNQDRNNIDQSNLLCLLFTRFVHAPHRIYLYNFLLNIATFTIGHFNMEAFNKKGAPKRIADVIVY